LRERNCVCKKDFNAGFVAKRKGGGARGVEARALITAASGLRARLALQERGPVACHLLY